MRTYRFLMTREQFEHIAQEAFDSLPATFRDRVENVQIVVEDYPSDDALDHAGDRYSLLGLYQGIPLPHRGTWYGSSATVPDKITLYQKNIEAVCRDEEEIVLKIREVLFHELGHYFGMNEEQVRKAMKGFLST
ncbi:MAG: metallopeptidase family protein [Bacteroidota bacterium]